MMSLERKGRNKNCCLRTRERIFFNASMHSREKEKSTEKSEWGDGGKENK
jgi:hypothetical protein